MANLRGSTRRQSTKVMLLRHGAHVHISRSCRPPAKIATRGFPFLRSSPTDPCRPSNAFLVADPRGKMPAEVNALGWGTKATIVAAVIAPAPGIVASRRIVSSRRTSATISCSSAAIRWVALDLVGQHFGAPSGQRREAGRSLVANDTDQRLDPFPAPLAAMIASSPR